MPAPPRRFLLVALGTRADARPLLALALALRAAGHVATVLVESPLVPFVDTLGLAPLSLPPAAPPAPAEISLPDTPPNPVMLETLYARLAPVFPALLDALAAHLPQHDVLIIPHVLSFLHLAAHKAGRSCAALVFRPDFVPHPHHAPAHVSPPHWLPKLLHSAHHRGAWRSWESRLVEVAHRHAGPHLHTRGLGKFSGFLTSPADLALVLVSPRLFPAADPPPSPYTYTGFLDPLAFPEPSASSILASLTTLARGGSPICVLCLDGVGPGAEALYVRRVTAAWPLGYPLVIQSDRSQFAPLANRPEIFSLGPVPLAALFSPATVVIHHGQGEIAAAALHAARTQIVIHSASGSACWPESLLALGVATLLPYETWPEELPAAANILLHDLPKVRRVAESAALLRSEDGPAHAVAALARLTLR